MRRLAPLLIATLLPSVLLAPASSAQEPASVRLTLLSQTPWNSMTEPVVELRFRAENTGDTRLADLSLGLTLYSRVITRSAYELSLVSDPPIVIDAETLAREGSLDPGAIRDFEVSFTLDSPGVSRDQSGVYPLKVDLRSAERSLAALRSPTIFLVRQPEVPLSLSWTFVLDHPISFGPDGTFLDDSLETSLEPGGRLAGQIRALQELAATPSVAVEVAVSPVLLMQLGRMRDGYSVAEADGAHGVPAGEGGAALAAQAIKDLRAIADAPGVRLSALPFSAPELPSLYAGGLGRDVPVQLERGREVVAAFLQTEPVTGVLRPPGAALDDTTLRDIAALGVGALIVDPGTVQIPPQPLELTGPATARLAEGGVAAISPDPATEAVMALLAPVDAALAAQAALGELATIWLERPGESRGVAVVLGEDQALPGPFFSSHARGIATAPWLQTVTPTELILGFPPVDTSELAEPSFRRFSPTYTAALKQARRRVDTVRSMLPVDSDQPVRLDAMLLLAEARQYLSEPDDGFAFIGSVRNQTDAILNSLELETVSPITLTSESGGGIPVTVTNVGSESVKVSVRLVSQHLRETLSSDLELAPGGSETVRFQAQLRSTGRFPVSAQVVSPNGRILEQATIVVRSTEYNRFAIVITIGAALVLLILWARRFVPRRSA